MISKSRTKLPVPIHILFKEFSAIVARCDPLSVVDAEIAFLIKEAVLVEEARRVDVERCEVASCVPATQLLACGGA